MNKIANYDTLDYDYKTYWTHREYENEAEHIALEKLLSNTQGEWFIDIGGSYGRLADTYYDRFTKPVIIDYSLKTLQKNRDFILKSYPNIQLIAANAYNLPFKSNSFDGGLMVRVLHHINEPEKYFKEIHRILADNSTYIQEFANKIHIKAVARAVLSFNFKLLSKEPYQQPDRDNNEGATKNANVPFLNYHPIWVKEQLNKYELNVKNKLGCSFLRIPALKRALGLNTMSTLENLLQEGMSWSNISPSIFFKTFVRKGTRNTLLVKLEDILACPSCKGDLELSKERAKCVKCEKEYLKKEGIWDFRV